MLLSTFSKIALRLLLVGVKGIVAKLNGNPSVAAKADSSQSDKPSTAALRFSPWPPGLSLVDDGPLLEVISILAITEGGG